jgi:DNA-binding MarR family transcriptional regulator/GNAT superfamily N-acetyltransferase
MDDAAVRRVRKFNRFYTERIGVLTDHLLHSDYSLTEVRVLYEIEHRASPRASVIGADLGIDRGYMSRMLKRFQREGLLRRTPVADDARARALALTARGRRVMQTLERRSDEQVAGLLRGKPAADQGRLLGAMRTIEDVLGPAVARETSPAPVTLRDPRPGDLGWIVHRHGALYAREYGYDQRFEALVAKIVGEFVERFDPRRERCWVADAEGDVVGSVFLVRHTDAVGKLRLLYVEPHARGQRVGERLVGECVAFARKAGYRKVTLWTQSELGAARRLYEKAGFVLTKEEPHASFGRTDLVAETWDLAL